MAEIAKGFVVNGEEYKIDYNSLINLPFGKEVTEVLLPMQTDVAFQDTPDGVYFCPIPVQINLIAGDKYIVNWDGTEYETVAVYHDGEYMIGDMFLRKSEAKHEFPFAIGENPGDNILIIETTEQGNHSFSITYKYVTRLVSKYLPQYLNMDNREQLFVTESDGTSANSDTDITVDGTTYYMYYVDRTGDYYPTSSGFPMTYETYLVTINGVEHRAFCSYSGGNDYYLLDNWDDPSFIVRLNYYGGIGNPSVSFYLPTADTAVTWSVKRITHNVLPVSYAPLLKRSGDEHIMTIVDALNYLSNQSGYGTLFFEYNEQPNESSGGTSM